jgi:precorrin-6B methylase 2
MPVDINYLTDWNKLELKLISPTNNAGQLTHLELIVIIGMTKSFLKPGENFLEIGTFDGNTALNIAKNIPEESKLITIDLPENTSIKAKFNYDNLLIEDENRSKKKHLNLKNVEQIYHDSTTYNFSKLTFSVAFIDGGHDYKTVKSDTLNVLKYIKRPGIIFWHDYDVECEIGDLLHELVKEYPIKCIKETRLAFLKIN